MISQAEADAARIRRDQHRADRLILENTLRAGGASDAYVDWVLARWLRASHMPKPGTWLPTCPSCRGQGTERLDDVFNGYRCTICEHTWMQP